MNVNKVCFIIAHKYFRGYESYLEYYISNIKKCYPEALTIVVDNNSLHKDDIFNKLSHIDNVIFLDNNIQSKFELGAYQVGINYILEKNLLNDYKYYIFTQDTFILKNKYDFSNMFNNNIYARPINSMYADGECSDVVIPVMTKLGMNDHWDKINFCWCSSFVVDSIKVKQLYSYLTSIVVLRRWESCASERYLARILFELNEHRDCGAIDGNCIDLTLNHYDTWNVNVYDNLKTFFVKKVQQKTENTKDLY
jgi:hypothetical protein